MQDKKDEGKLFWIFNTSRPQMFPLDFERRIDVKIPILDLDKEKTFDFFILICNNNNIKIDDKYLNKYSNYNNKKITNKEYIMELLYHHSNSNIQKIVNEIFVEKEIKKDIDIISIIENLNIPKLIEKRNKQTEYAKKYSTYKDLTIY